MIDKKAQIRARKADFLSSAPALGPTISVFLTSNASALNFVFNEFAISVVNWFKPVSVPWVRIKNSFSLFSPID